MVPFRHVDPSIKKVNQHSWFYSGMLVAQLVQSEQLSRAQEKTAMYLKLAKLRLPATIEQIECSASRNLTKQQLASLAEGRYLQQGENLLITGSTGCGKSYLACALGHQACLQGYKTSYRGMNRLIEKITLSKLDGSYITQKRNGFFCKKMNSDEQLLLRRNRLQ